MADFGRIHAFSITNRQGCVLYERFYDRFSEVQKAELRNALGQCSRDVAKMPSGQVGVGNFRGATTVYQPLGNLVYYCVGSGEYDELTLLAALQCIVGCLKGAIKTDKPPQEAQILAKYDKVCIVIDEVIHEEENDKHAQGLLDTLDPAAAVASIKMGA